jgi:hypothetical protein
MTALYLVVGVCCLLASGLSTVRYRRGRAHPKSDPAVASAYMFLVVAAIMFCAGVLLIINGVVH